MLPEYEKKYNEMQEFNNKISELETDVDSLNALGLQQWKLKQFHSRHVTSGTEYSFKMKCKKTSINWEYDIYKLSIVAGEANVLMIKDVYIYVGQHDTGNPTAGIIKQSIIHGEDKISSLSVSYDGNETITITYKTNIGTKIKLIMEPCGVY